MSTETTNKKIKIDNGTTFGKTYTDKAVDERLQGLVSTATFTPVKEKANNSLQKPAGLTKTELVGVGTNGQENIEIGDNLTLANGKLSATGGGSGGVEINILNGDYNTMTYTGTLSPNKLNLLFRDDIYYVISYYNDNIGIFISTDNNLFFYYVLQGGKITTGLYNLKYYSHFITMTDSSSNVTLYLTIINTDETFFTPYNLAPYLEGKKVLVNGNLHGVVPTYITSEGRVIKIYYRTPGDNNINLQPDEYQDLSSFTITDLVTPVE